LYATPAIWAFLAVIAVFRLNMAWFMVCMVAISMSTANVAGYSKCEKDFKKKTAAFVTEQGFMQNMVNSAISSKLTSFF
jgi:hypothetical protein